MKILTKGRPQRGWAQELAGRDLDQMWSFTCSACGCETDLAGLPLRKRLRLKRRSVGCAKAPRPKPINGHCSFCGEKSKLVSAPAVYICETCAKLAIEIFEEDRQG